MSTAYSIDRGSPDDDRAIIFALAENFTGAFPVARFEKYYRENLLEEPAIVIARASSSGEPAGMGALLPTDLVVDGHTLRGGITGDFVTAPEHRGFGPALKIEMALIEAARERGYAFVYGTPNAAAHPLIKRMGYTDLGPLSMYLKVLRAGFPVKQLTGNSHIARAASIIDPLLSLAARRHRFRPQDDLMIVPVDEVDARFASVLAASATAGVRGARSPELLNWKFELHERASRRFQLAAVGTSQEIAAYAISTQRDGVTHVVDLGFASNRALKAQLAVVMSSSKQDRASMITVRYFGDDPALESGLRSVGFIKRQDSLRLMVLVDDSSSFATQLRNPGTWRFFAGDMDL